MSELPTAGPLPSKHVFLHELAKLPAGSKVRFLGCVVDYEVSTGSILLEHAFPQQMLPTPTVSVDVQLILESIKAPDLQRCSWLNVIGYVRKSEQRRKETSNPSADDIKRAPIPIVQAINMWSAGAIRVGDYEAALTNQREKKAAVEVPLVHQ